MGIIAQNLAVGLGRFYLDHAMSFLFGLSIFRGSHEDQFRSGITVEGLGKS